ncbi:MAG: hypothetical protein KA731_00420 [Candidatus Moranbacteria bacterium]|nr:hypothetical protein [Candidatus Moranbacteria bacterium]MBP6033883.1 hypothetical protein [Candidatus Moranbacteria bacterium]MBP7695659.1 hypothetical protein [Candidatus Moranbacteria bacterium]
MESQLFSEKSLADHLFDICYDGPSFDGAMEISLLKNEIAGLDNALRIAAQVLAKHKKIDFRSGDVEIYIEAFERGSFKKKVKVVLKSLQDLNQYQGAIALGALVISVMTFVKQQETLDIDHIPPEIMAQFKTQVEYDLLQNREFLKSVSDIVAPLNQSGDHLHIAVPKNSETDIDYLDKEKFIKLALPSVVEGVDGDKHEIIVGRINRVDLDATIRHIGFKVKGEGSSIPATLSTQVKSSVSMNDLLGKWVEMGALTTYKGDIREHIEIEDIKIVEQQKLPIDFNNEGIE